MLLRVCMHAASFRVHCQWQLEPELAIAAAIIMIMGQIGASASRLGTRKGLGGRVPFASG